MGRPSERLEFLEKELQARSTLPIHLQVQYHEEAIPIAIYSGNNHAASRLIDSYLNLFEEPVPYETMYFCKYKEATIFWRESRMDEAEKLYSFCRELAEKNGDLRAASRCFMAAGVIAWNRRDYSRSLKLLEKAEAGLRSRRDETLSNCLNWLGIVCSNLDMSPRAWKYYTEALEMNQEMGLEASQAYLLSNLGLLCNNMGLIDQAEDSYRRSIQLHEKIGNKYGVIDSRANLAMLILSKRNKPEIALPMLIDTAEMQLDAGLKDKAGLVFTNAAVAAFRVGDERKSLVLFKKAEELLTEADAWDFLTEMSEKKVSILISMGRFGEADFLLERAKQLHREHRPDSPDAELLRLESEIALHGGDYRKAYQLLNESCNTTNKLEATRAAALQDVIRIINESAEKNRQLQEARHQAALLEKRNATLAASERRFRQIVDRISGVGVFALDTQGIITFWNSTCEELYGFKAFDVLGQKPHDLIIPAKSREAFESILSNGTPGENWELDLTTADGRSKNVHISLLPLMSGETFVVQVDLTCQREAEIQRKKIETQLRRTQKLEALGTLAGGIAHDFNNLLQGILANACVLCDSISESSEIHTNAELILLAAERSSELCTQMLDYAGVKPVGHEILDMNSLVKDMAILLSTSLPKNVELVFHPSPATHLVSGDRSQLRQVVMNLALNGAEAVQGSGKVTISTSDVEMSRDDFSGNLLEETPPPGTYLSLKVRDNGEGIDAGTLSRIFDPFFSTKKTGRGLGLSAVLGIIRAHGGAITVNSAPGLGTEFNVFLKAEDVQRTTAHKSYQAMPVELTGRSMLIVDDEEIVRDTVEVILRKAGCNPVTVKGGAEALEYLDSNWSNTDIVILDLTMPGMDGVDVFRLMQERNYTVPVLLVSGYTSDKLESVFGSISPAGFLQKPFTPSELLESLYKLLSTGKIWK